jgi:hypothetical protein
MQEWRNKAIAPCGPQGSVRSNISFFGAKRN